MPTFTQTAGADRNLRVRPAFAPPLLPVQEFGQFGTHPPHCYDVVIVGAGPAGLFLKLLLARYGLPDTSVLCIDQRAGTIQTGQADGLQPRTLEVLESLGICGEVLSEGCQLWEVGFWNAAPSDSGPATGGIERTGYAADVVVRARFPHEITIHQGRIERIISEDLAKYSSAGVQYSTHFKDFQVSESTNAAFPLEIKIEEKEETSGNVVSQTIRAKHIVAADGAHSTVRAAAGLELVGESKDYIWGVMDFIADTDFPDVRRRTAIHSRAGSAMVIPRERIATGEYLTRLYIQMDDVEISGESQAINATTSKSEIEDARQVAREKRQRINLDTLFKQAESVFKPYYLQMKEGTEPDWWAAYQIGQRMTNAFTKEDERGISRVFVVGDAAHTHSPKAGQGMNVSMMDSYNLAWKLAYHLLSLSPNKSSGSGSPSATPILQSYASERRAVAHALIDFDQRFSTMFSGKVGSTEHDASGEPLTHEKFLEVFSSGSGFSSGCGIEYDESLVVSKQLERTSNGDSRSPWIRVNWPAAQAQELLQGALYPGRRLASVRVIRHADGVPHDLHEAFPSTGRFRILLLCAEDLLSSESLSSKALVTIGRLIDDSRHPKLIELVVLHPRADLRGIDWCGLPSPIKKHAEMRFFGAAAGIAPEGKVDGSSGVRGSQAEDGYRVFCVHQDVGAWAVIRPDGVVGAMGVLEDIGKVETYLRGVIAI